MVSDVVESGCGTVVAEYGFEGSAEMMLQVVSFIFLFSKPKKNCFHAGRAIQRRTSSGVQIAPYSPPGPGDAMLMTCVGASVAFNH